MMKTIGEILDAHIQRKKIESGEVSFSEAFLNAVEKVIKRRKGEISIADAIRKGWMIKKERIGLINNWLKDPEIRKETINVLKKSLKKKKATSVSKDRLKKDVEGRKIFCYVYHKKLGFGLRELGRVYERNKDTIKNWIEEIESLPEEEREAKIRELQIPELRKLRKSQDKDVLDLPEKMLKSLPEVEYSLTENGLYQTGRKLKHKIPDQDDHNFDF